MSAVIFIFYSLPAEPLASAHRPIRFQLKLLVYMLQIRLLLIGNVTRHPESYDNIRVPLS